jgi:hypothetical protein
MAKIYAAWEGGRPIRNSPIGQIPFDKVVPLLQREQHIRNDKPIPFGVQGSNPGLDDFRDPSAIYIEVDDQRPIRPAGAADGTSSRFRHRKPNRF